MEKKKKQSQVREMKKYKSKKSHDVVGVWLFPTWSCEFSFFLIYLQEEGERSGYP